MSSAPPESSKWTAYPDFPVRRREVTAPSLLAPIAPAPQATFNDATPGKMSEITLDNIQGAAQCGTGGFGVVWILEHPTKGKLALKQLQVSRVQGADDVRRRTLREAETWQELKHPHVLPFLGILETSTDLYLISPYVQNGSLDNYIRLHPDTDRRRFLQETAGAIAYLHECGIVHGDIKASNILVSDDIHVLLCDFGLARFEATATSVGLEGVGTVRFQSPELLMKGGGKTFASDAWAFGMTIYEVLSSNMPYHEYHPGSVIYAITVNDERPPKSPSQSPSGVSYDHIWVVASDCWDKNPARRLSMQNAYIGLGPGPRVLQSTAEINCLAFSPDGAIIVSGSGDHTLQLWDTELGTPQGDALKGHEREVYDVAFSPDGKSIVLGSIDHTLRLWNVESGDQQGEALKGHTGDVYSVAFSPDGKTIVSGSTDRTLRLWDASSGTPIGDALKGHTGEVYAVAFSLDGATIVSGSQDRTIRRWDVGSRRQLGKALRGHREPVLCVAFSPDGTTIVSGSTDYTIRLWNAESWIQRRGTLKGHTDRIWSVAFSPDGKTIVSGSEDHTIRLWDAGSGSQLGVALKGHTDWVWSVAFSPDGKTVASGSPDHTLRLWTI